MRKVIFGIMFAAMLLAGCATNNTRGAAFDLSGNPSRVITYPNY